MIVRALNSSNDWTFGQGLQNYKSGNLAVQQEIQTNVLFFLNDCFFALNKGIDWFNLLGGKNQALLNLQVTSAILNSPGVLNLLQLSINLIHETRALTIEYTVNTIYTGTAQTVAGTVEYLITQGGEFIDTEDGDRIII